jgi:hypothetical protein
MRRLGSFLMNYPLYELTWQEFEDVVISICEDILGIGTIKFAYGMDGGRDAKFSGTANNFPSFASPWSGKFIIQAKHTTKANASCSDNDFKTILNDEIKSITKLQEADKLNNYLIFTNRKLTGIQDPKIEDLINEELSVKNQVIGEERIQKYLKDYPVIVTKHNLNRLLLPLQFYEEDLKDIILSFSNTDFSGEELQKIKRKNDKITIEEKNRLNKMSKIYFNNSFKKSIKEFNEIEKFFKSPKNRKLTKQYDNTIDDIQAKIIIKRAEYSTFEEILEYLYDYMLNAHELVLKNDRRLIRVFFHYMYFHCDIGVME